MDRLELAYVAGLFDGEGSISLYSEPLKQYRLARISVDLANTDFSILEYLKSNFGGSIHYFHKANRRAAGTWHLSYKKAVEFLMLIQPYLKIKQQQVLVAKEVYEITNRRRRNGQRNSQGQFEALSAIEKQKLLELIDKMHCLNMGEK